MRHMDNINYHVFINLYKNSKNHARIEHKSADNAILQGNTCNSFKK